MSKKQISLLNFLRKPAKPSSSPALLSFRNSREGQNDLQPESPISSTQQTICPSRKRKRESDKKYDAEQRTREFKSHWQSAYPWVEFDGEFMFCTVCREFQHLLSSKNVSFLKGSTSFRKESLDNHHTSAAHGIAMGAKAAKEAPQEAPLGIIKARMNTQQCSNLTVMFNTAYCLALRNWSFRDFRFLCELQAKNGLQLMSRYQNTHGAKTFVQSIAHVQRQETVNGIKSCRFFSVLADGSTDRSVAEQECVYVRYVVKGVPVSKFVGLEELENANADGVLTAINNALCKRVGVDLDTLKNKLVNMNMDGAAVNMGKKGGVGSKQKALVGEHVTVTHCVNHGLELAILELHKDDEYLKTFESTLKGVFSFYHYSPKQGRELSKIATELDQQLAHFGGIQHIRWVASQSRALKALINNYAITCTHFEYIAANSTTTQASKVRGLLTRLKSPKFLTYLLFMMDFTTLIGGLSEFFQTADLMLMDVAPRISATIYELVDMRENPGPNVSSLTSGNVYNGITLSGVVEPVLNQHHKNLVDFAISHMDTRFKALHNPPLSDFAVLDYTQWPLDKKELSSYGVENIKRLVHHFTPVLTQDEVAKAPLEWFMFKHHVCIQRNSPQKDVYKSLLLHEAPKFKHILPLIEIMLSISMSTATVERGFSVMNVVKDETRTLLGNDTLNDLVEIKVNGVSLDDFTPESAILHWLDKGKGKRHI